MNPIFWQLATGYLLAGVVFGSLILARMARLQSANAQAAQGTLLDVTAMTALLFLFWPIGLVLLMFAELAVWLFGGGE